MKAYIINRNLLTTLRSTVEFLLKEPRIEVVIWDQNSDYPPLMQYYRSLQVRDIPPRRLKVQVSPQNLGPHSVWSLRPELDREPYIICDSDCTYDSVPGNWLDKMLEVLDNTTYNKVGFSLSLEGLPENDLSREVRDWEAKYWSNLSPYGWIADIDTTFALYRQGTGFDYKAIRLERPYTILHAPWYITPDNLTEEWRYYLDTCSNVSTWGQKLKKLINETK